MQHINPIEEMMENKDPHEEVQNLMHMQDIINERINIQSCLPINSFPLDFWRLRTIIMNSLHKNH